MKSVRLFLIAVLTAGTVHAGAPFVTESVSMDSPKSLNVELSPGYRVDKFKSPGGSAYTATLTRVDAKARWVPFTGFETSFAAPYVSRKLSGTGGTSESGVGQAILGGKFAFGPKFGAAASVELPTADQDKLLGEGMNIGVAALAETGFRDMTLYGNLGYLLKPEYKVKGVKADPGDVIGLSGAAVRTRNDVDWFGEVNVYIVGDAKVAGATISNSGGNAIDLRVGAGKMMRDFYVRGALAFDMGDEEVSSMDLTRGAGDTQLLLSATYRFPKRDHAERAPAARPAPKAAPAKPAPKAAPAAPAKPAPKTPAAPKPAAKTAPKSR